MMRPLSAWLTEGLDDSRRSNAPRTDAPPPPAEAQVGHEISGERQVPLPAYGSDRPPPPSRLPESYTKSRSSGARIMLGLVDNPYKR